MKSSLAGLLLLTFIAFSTLLSTGNGCFCIPRTIEQAFFESEIFIRAKVVQKLSNIDTFRYRLEVTRIYKGCSVPSQFWVTSRKDSGLCGIDLTEDVSYIFPLPRLQPFLFITSCQVRHLMLLVVSPQGYTVATFYLNLLTCKN